MIEVKDTVFEENDLENEGKVIGSSGDQVMVEFGYKKEGKKVKWINRDNVVKKWK